MMRVNMKSCVLLMGLIAVGGSALPARGESKHVFGIHSWDWGANVDVMSHRTGWVVEANTTSNGESPNVGGRYKPATAEGFTILQRLDWSWDQTIPLTTAQQDQFAQQCATWAGKIKKYCRHYSIGNEVEYFGVTPEIYAAAFQKVRTAILNEQPEAVVIIGHMNDGEHQRAAIRILGPNGYDGITDHVPSSVPSGGLDMLDQEGARPGVGLYVTEWGWVSDTNPNSMSVMRSFYLEIGQSNRTRTRQVYCACWYLYPNFLGSTFSLELATRYDNPAFEAATAIGTTVNSYSSNPVTMSNLYADIDDAGFSVDVHWNTNVAAKDQMWWTPAGTYGAGNEQITDLNSGLSTTHNHTVQGLTPATAYEVMPTSTRDGYGDAGGRRFKIKTGPWATSASMAGARRVRLQWNTSWPTDSRVEYGPTLSLGMSTINASQVTAHSVDLAGQNLGVIYYRVLSGAVNPDGNVPLLMRSPTRSFVVVPTAPGDFDGDGDADLDDFGYMQNCMTGAGIEQPNPACLGARLDGDQDVDTADARLFMGCMTAPGVAVSPNCLP